METKFLRKVEKTETCWDWTASTTPTGYGRFGVGGYAHRTAYELYNGPIPEGLVVRHMCNNRKCVNPAHLEVGTVAENNADKTRDGTVRYGEDIPSHKLTQEQADDIKRRLANYTRGMVGALAVEYSVSAATISKIRNGTAWRNNVA